MFGWVDGWMGGMRRDAGPGDMVYWCVVRGER